MTAIVRDDDRAFLGHPKALGYLAFTEAWERFSYYGMQSLLVLYMTKQLLLTPHVERIAGFSAFESFIQAVYHPGLSTQAISSAIFGLYTSLVYLTPIRGGIVADRVLGKTKTIILGALLQVGSGSWLVVTLAAISILIASINIVGGFLVTRRMLAMFQKS